MKKLSYIISLFICAGLYGQSTISLNTTPQAGGIMTACNSISLLPGFSFQATSTKNLNLAVSPTTCDPYSGDPPTISPGIFYIRTKRYTSDEGSRHLDAIQYYDDAGRPVQLVQRGITPSTADLVISQDFDSQHREISSKLPLPVPGNNGAFVQDILGKTKTFYGDQNPYTKIIYDNAHSDALAEIYSPGQDWHKTYGNDSKAVKTEYMANAATGVLSCAQYTCGIHTDISIKKTGNYAAGVLSVTKVTGEDGDVSYEFKDVFGQVVLIRQMNGATQYDTYYIYDDFGILKAVLPPLASDALTATNTTWNESTTALKDYAYLYTHDKYNRCISKKLPGCEPVYYVYDKADRLIFTQDGEQRIKPVPEWTFTIPDAFGRIVLTGTCTNSLTYTACPLKDILVKATCNTSGTNLANSYTITGITLAGRKILSANYYDSYSFMGITELPNNANTQYNAETGYGTQYTGGYKGLLTGTLTARMKPDGEIESTYLYSVMYYDNRGRLIQAKSNNHLGGFEKEYIAYNFTGQPTQSKHVHSVTGKPTQTEVYTYSYDHAGRLLKTTHQLTDGTTVKPLVTLAENTYDELGRLKTTQKATHANLKTTYGYNIRSWTKSISSPLFNQSLYYNESYGGSAKQYSGNISAMSWKHNTEANTRGYAFTYDNLSRLTVAGYLVNGAASNNFRTAYSYDKHGNMKTLQRYGKTTATAYGLADNLTMTYTGNQLLKAEDAVATISLAESADFKNYANAATEYTYNKNGAMVKDLNKGISAIQYNSLNLPRQMDIKSPVAEARNEYTYSASGQKLKVVQKWNPNFSTAPVIGSGINASSLTQSKTTDYVGNIIYENNSLKRILVDGGYIEGGVYYFYQTDHLGNNRVVVKADGTVIQRNHYYPFGMAFAETPLAEQGKQPYKYNGKELDQMHGLNLYDYSARQYDPAIGRFPTVDPHAEKYYSWSPYSYCFNNPMRFIDKDGRDPGTPFRSKDDAAKDWGRYYNGASILRGKEMSSSLYTYQKGGKTYYTYTEANIGTNAGVSPSEPTNGEKVVGDIHSHGKFEARYDNNEFSGQDKRGNDKNKIDGYVTTPDGSLKKYDVKTKKESVLSTDLQSDPKDPQRKNKNDPVDVPQNKENQMKRTEEELKSNYRGSHGGYNTIDP